MCTCCHLTFVGAFHAFKICVQVWDLGGQANLRPSWATYYQQTDCIILVRHPRKCDFILAGLLASVSPALSCFCNPCTPGPQVVDSTDRGRVGIARKELTSLLGACCLMHCCIAVLK